MSPRNLRIAEAKAIGTLCKSAPTVPTRAMAVVEPETKRPLRMQRSSIVLDLL
jgi:hypothetical protein